MASARNSSGSTGSGTGCRRAAPARSGSPPAGRARSGRRQRGPLAAGGPVPRPGQRDRPQSGCAGPATGRVLRRSRGGCDRCCRRRLGRRRAVHTAGVRRAAGRARHRRRGDRSRVDRAAGRGGEGVPEHRVPGARFRGRGRGGVVGRR